ncbi:MAG: hypothetical protein ABI041_03780, partial [Bdellovibrionia bacterium]
EEVADSVVLDLDAQAIRAFVRFDHLDKSHDPEGRYFDYLKISSNFEELCLSVGLEGHWVGIIMKPFKFNLLLFVIAQ